jgi:hypothetical protein
MKSFVGKPVRQKPFRNLGIDGRLILQWIKGE